MEEKQTKKIGKRRTQAQRLMPTKHLEQLTKKARALAGEVEPEDVSLSSITQKLARLQQVHSQLQESLVSGSDQLAAARLRQEIGDAQAECTSGERVESFYLALAGESAFESLSVRAHTIPFFVPYKEAATAYLSSNASMFINSTGDLLQAYTSRREQIKKLKESKADKIKLISHTVLCDAVDFLVEEFDCKVLVKLRYEDLQSDFPTETKVVAWPPPPSKKQYPVFFSKERKPKAAPISLLFAETILQQELLPEACERLVSGFNALLAGRSVDDTDMIAPPSGDS